MVILTTIWQILAFQFIVRITRKQNQWFALFSLANSLDCCFYETDLHVMWSVPIAQDYKIRFHFSPRARIVFLFTWFLVAGRKNINHFSFRTVREISSAERFFLSWIQLKINISRTVLCNAIIVCFLSEFQMIKCGFSFGFLGKWSAKNISRNISGKLFFCAGLEYNFIGIGKKRKSFWRLRLRSLGGFAPWRLF